MKEELEMGNFDFQLLEKLYTFYERNKPICFKACSDICVVNICLLKLHRILDALCKY